MNKTPHFQMNPPGALLLIKSHVFQVEDHNPIVSICDRICDSGFAIHKTEARIRPTQIQELYKEHEGKDFHKRLIRSVSGPVLAFYLVSQNPKEDHAEMIARLRALVGATDPKAAAPSSLRHDFGTVLPYNAVHCSDSCESATRELGLFFNSLPDV